MLLDLRKLKRTGKQTTSFYFEYTPQDNLSESLEGSEILSPIKISGEITLTGEHSAFVEGDIAFAIKGECTRCLEQTTKDFNASFAEAVSNDDEEGYELKNDTIDLSKIVDDAVLMNIPVQFLCREDCKGLCSSCGTNLNDAQCECKKQ